MSAPRRMEIVGWPASSLQAMRLRRLNALPLKQIALSRSVNSRSSSSSGHCGAFTVPMPSSTSPSSTLPDELVRRDVVDHDVDGGMRRTKRFTIAGITAEATLADAANVTRPRVSRRQGADVVAEPIELAEQAFGDRRSHPVPASVDRSARVVRSNRRVFQACSS